MQQKKLILLSVSLVFFSAAILPTVHAAFVPGGGGGNPVTKYGFFFWTTYDFPCQTVIDTYENILQSKGYYTYEFKDLKRGSTQYTISTAMSFIDSLEDYNDIVFLYFAGHGWYYESTDTSTVYIKSNVLTISSSQLRSYSNWWETDDVCILVDSCHAGDFVDEFQNKDDYLVMSSSDEDYEALYNRITKEPCFSSTFWWFLNFYPNLDALDAFYNARMIWPFFHAQFSDNSNYDFF
jgi:hypothetical protein